METIDVRKPVPLFSIREAAARGIERVYSPIWVGTMDHVKLDLVEGGTFGPWLHLYSPCNLIINGRDPVDFLAMPPLIDIDSKCLYAYCGPLPDSDEYRAEVEGRTMMIEAATPSDATPP